MLEELVKEVAESRSVTEGAVAFIGGLKAKVTELQGQVDALNPEALKAEIGKLATELDAQQANLAAALTTGTVADPSQPAPDNGVEAAPNNEPPVPPAEEVAVAAEETAAAVENAAEATPNP